MDSGSLRNINIANARFSVVSNALIPRCVGNKGELRFIDVVNGDRCVVGPIGRVLNALPVELRPVIVPNVITSRHVDLCGNGTRHFGLWVKRIAIKQPDQSEGENPDADDGQYPSYSYAAQVSRLSQARCLDE